ARSEKARDFHLHPWAHGRGNRHPIDIVAFGPSRLGFLNRIRKGLDVLDKLFFGERSLADTGLNDARLFDTELDRAALRALYSVCDVHGHRTDLWVRHDAARAEHLAEAPHQRHQVGRSNTAVEVDLTLAHFFNEVLRADNVGTCSLRLVCLGAAGKYTDAQSAAGAVRQRDHAADHLIRMRWIDAEVHRNLDRFIELRFRAFLDQLHRLGDRIGFIAINAFANGLRALSDCHGRYSVTVRPIERAEPSIIFIAASTVSQFRSFIFCSAISRTCFLLTCPTGSRPGVFAPLSIFAAFLRKYDTGGVFISKVKERS